MELALETLPVDAGNVLRPQQTSLRASVTKHRASTIRALRMYHPVQ
jgi:hypothetical protein